MKTTKSPSARAFVSYLSVAITALVLMIGPNLATAVQIVFTIDPALSSSNWAGTDTASGLPYATTSEGSLSAPITGNFRVDFDPTTSTPPTIQVIGDTTGQNGYFLVQSPVSGQAPGVSWQISNLSWTFSNSSPMTPTSPGEHTFTTTPSSNPTGFYVLSGGATVNSAHSPEATLEVRTT